MTILSVGGDHVLFESAAVIASVKLYLVLVEVFPCPFAWFDGVGNAETSNISPSSVFGSRCEIRVGFIGFRCSLFLPVSVCFLSAI